MRWCIVVLLATALTGALPAVVAGSGAAVPVKAEGCVPAAGVPLKQPRWATGRRMTIIVDSVLLSGESALRRAMPGWVIVKRGRPALMVRVADRELAPVRRVNRLVVVAIGYNSLWERGRRRYTHWARQFDRDATRLMRSLRRRGAEQIVWITLRQPTPATVPRRAVRELSQYSWYFPYTNERLRLLDARHDDLVLADWRRAGDRPGVTYDTIHLNERGGRLMARTIKTAITDEARRQSCKAAGGGG